MYVFLKEILSCLFQLVLVIGASHLRSIADGIVPMPEDSYTFGIMSTPGGCADQLRTEVEHAVLPRSPDAVCVMAPGNNLTASHTPEQGGVAFDRYLATVCSVWCCLAAHLVLLCCGKLIKLSSVMLT